MAVFNVVLVMVVILSPKVEEKPNLVRRVFRALLRGLWATFYTCIAVMAMVLMIFGIIILGRLAFPEDCATRSNVEALAALVEKISLDQR